MRGRRRSGRKAPARPAGGAPTPAPWLRWATLLFALLVYAGTALVRLRLAGVPLERDEGEYAYAGQLILQGVPPYQLAYNMKFPGTYYAYSVILAVFGDTPFGIHLGLLVVNAATAATLFFLGRRLIGEFGAAIGAAAFAVFSVDRWIMGIFAHATHFVLLPALGGFLLLLRAADSRRSGTFLAAGTLLGVAVLMKQQAAAFLLYGGLAAVVSALRGGATWREASRRLALVAAGAGATFGALCALFAAQGVLQRFWFWTFEYARAYVVEVPISDAWPLLASGVTEIMQANRPIWVLGAVGAAMLWLTPWSSRARWFVTGLLAASFVAVSPGFFFREHYFILMLPAVGLCVGVAAAGIERLLARPFSFTVARVLAILVVAGVFAAYVRAERVYLSTMDIRALSRSRYGSNPFVEAPGIAAYIQQRTTLEDRVAVVGSEPEIYFYAQRKSATGYVYTYALMEPQPYAARMQSEMIQEITAAHPRYLVLAAVATSWLARPASDLSILRWAERYTDACYNLVGLADIYSEEASAVLWDGALEGYVPRSENLVYTFRRKSDAPCSAGQ